MARTVNAGAWYRRIGWGAPSVTVLVLAAVVLPLFGRRFWIADLFSHFVPHYVLLGGLLAAALWVTRRRRLAVVALAVAVLELSRVVSAWAPPVAEAGPSKADLRLAQFNVNIHQDNPWPTITWVTNQDPDVVVLIEVTQPWLIPLDRLRSRYPATLVKRHPNGTGIAVLSRLPNTTMHLEYLGDRWRPTVVLRAPVGPKAVPLTIYAAHFSSPISRSDAAARNRQTLALAERLRADTSPHKIAVGDFNMTRWSPWFGVLADAIGLSGNGHGLGLQATWPTQLGGTWMGVAIDHALVSRSLRVVSRQVGPHLGSDHRPVITTIEIPTAG